MKILMDVDTGVDDSLALLYALHKPGAELVGITTSYGNVDVGQATENTLKILDLAGADPDLPVAAGATGPLEGQWEGVVEKIHGANGLGNVVLPATARKPLTMDAADFMIAAAKAHDGELVIITLGPLTNLAIALKRYPALVSKVRKVVMMGGTLHMRGNVGSLAEANVHNDPLACDKVFQSGLDILAVGLDVTMKVRLKREHLESISRCCSDRHKEEVGYLRQAMEYYMLGNRLQNYCLEDCPLHDPLAVIAAFNPDMVLVGYRKARVECGGQFFRGSIVTDLREQPIDAKYVGFAVEVEADRVIRELMSVFWRS